MEKNIVSSIDLSVELYLDFMRSHIENFENDFRLQQRLRQINIFKKIISEHFFFDEINVIETGVSGRIGYGMFGYFLASLVNQFGGRMASVDINCESCSKSKEIFNNHFPNLKYQVFCEDSLNFLKTPPFIPNLIHLDSYDFQLFNPFPSALHHWKEFETIEKLIPKGSIIFVDDNWMKGTKLQWIQNGVKSLNNIEYPIIGKGANIYNEVIQGNTNFTLIGEDYQHGDNVKIYLKKK